MSKDLILLKEILARSHVALFSVGSRSSSGSSSDFEFDCGSSSGIL